MSRPPHIPNRGDVPPSTVAQRLGLGDFELEAPGGRLSLAQKECHEALRRTDQRITSGPAAKRPHPKAEYMTAPERFADNSQIPLALRAPSIHDPTRTWAAYFCSDVPCQARTPRLGVLPPQSVLEAIEVMIVQRWGEALRRR